jgi:alkanesulfonate monooxygenase SsuD/methylene tetrahydromethanopterin reductase-like flavin-dependent oxidoreductase (luciferase family)
MAQMMKYSAVGTPDAVLAYLEEFTDHADADELIVAHQSTGTEARLRSVELLADAARLVRA